MPALYARMSAQLPPRFVRGRRFRSRLFTPLFVTHPPLQAGLGPLVMDWAVNTRRERRLGSSDGSGARQLGQAS